MKKFKPAAFATGLFPSGEAAIRRSRRNSEFLAEASIALMSQASELREIAPHEREGWVAACLASEGVFPLVRAVLEGRQRGQVFATSGKALSLAVVTNFGFMQTFGPENDSEFDTALENAFERGGLQPRYMLWYQPPRRWQQRIDALQSYKARRRERIRFRFPSANSDCPIATGPRGIVLKLLDSSLVPQLAHLGVTATRFWASEEDLLRNAVAVCALDGPKLVGICYSACIAGGVAEVDVVTSESHRERGIGTACARGFVKECTSKGIVPTWDCFSSNAGSIRLAISLGFVEDFRYPLYSFNVPLALRGGKASE